MTQDALTQGNILQSQIQSRQTLLAKHLNAVKQHMSELSVAEQSTLTAAIQAIHTPVITVLEASLSALDGAFVKPSPDSTDGKK